MTRFPVAPLLARVDCIGDLARVVGVTRRTVHRKLHDGLLPHDADRWALAFGLTPWEVWGDWGEPWCPSVTLPPPAPRRRSTDWSPGCLNQTEPWTELAEADSFCFTRGEWEGFRSVAFIRRHADNDRYDEEHRRTVPAMRLA